MHECMHREGSVHFRDTLTKLAAVNAARNDTLQTTSLWGFDYKLDLPIPIAPYPSTPNATSSPRPFSHARPETLI